MLGDKLRGDSHNFNRHVSPQTLCGTKVFRKPRSVFWELFFFGKNSPFKEIFHGTRVGMNLELICSNEPFDNVIKGIESSVRDCVSTDFYSFGQLLGYSYYFGVQDLHKENVLLTEDGLQVVDAEQAFSEFVLPNQTLLLPANKNINWSAGLNILTQDPINILCTSSSRSLIDGFCEISLNFLSNIERIRSIIQSYQKELISQPLRVFFRGTRDYKEKLDGNSMITDWFSEELIQLDRGDIPYFFTFLDCNEVYYYSSDKWEFKAVVVPDSFKKYITFCAKNPLELITHKKIEIQWAQGMLYLVKNFTSLHDQDLSWSNCKVLKKQHQLEFLSSTLKMVTSFSLPSGEKS